MDLDIIKDKLQGINIIKQIYETEDQFIDKIVFYLCCIDYGISSDRAETLCNIYRNKRKYRVNYHQDIETIIKNITDKYNLNF